MYSSALQRTRALLLQSQHKKHLKNIICKLSAQKEKHHVGKVSFPLTQVLDNGDKVEYGLITSDKGTHITGKANRNDAFSIKRAIADKANNAVQQLLPYGYPNSVNTGYARFALFQMMASILGTVCGVLSMQSLLYAVGVGSNSTLPFAATINWVLKDGLGQLGGVLFASYVHSKFDADPKRWRVIAAVVLDASCFIELLTPFAPQYFLLIASIANVGKNISYLTTAASRAAIHKSFAIHENLADVTAKTGSQTILASLIGTSIGVSLSSVIGDQIEIIMCLFVLCSLSGLSCTYLSVSRVVIPTLTLSRFDILMENYLRDHVIMTPKEATDIEYLLGPSLYHQREFPRVKIGTDLHRAFLPDQDIQAVLETFSNENYLINVLAWDGNRHANVHILLKESASRRDVFQSLIHAYLIRHVLNTRGCRGKAAHFLDDHQQRCYTADTEIVRTTYEVMTGQAVYAEGANHLNLNQIHVLVDNLLNSPDWVIEEIHLESRMARIKSN